MMKLNNVLSWLKDINIQNADTGKPKPDRRPTLLVHQEVNSRNQEKGGGGQIKI